MNGYRRPPDVAAYDDGGVIYLAKLPDGPIVALDGVAGVIWTQACDGPRSSIADRAAAVTGAATDEIRADVESFVDELVQRGLLSIREVDV
jgi:hypothetical protein